MIKVYMMDGVEEIQSFDFEGDTVYIGRSPKNDLEMIDGQVSTRHLKIRKRGDRYFVQDLKSRNGTYVNGRLITPAVEVEVQEGVPITLGMSLICLGKACLDKVMPFVDAIFESDDLGEISGIPLKDRPMTPQRNMELFYNVSDVLKRSLTLNEILERILTHIFELLGRLDRGVILLIDGDSGKITEVLSKCKRAGDAAAVTYSRTVVKRVMEEKRAFMMLDTFREGRSDLSESMEVMKIRSVLCLPLISRSRMRGLIYLDSLEEPNGFRNDDLSLLTALSAPAALAIENALLYSGEQGGPLN